LYIIDLIEVAYHQLYELYLIKAPPCISSALWAGYHQLYELYLITASPCINKKSARAGLARALFLLIQGEAVMRYSS